MRRIILTMLTAVLMTGAALADGDHAWIYEVSVTNITPGQTFTPILAVTHKSSVSLFELGEAASPELAQLAESGNIMPLMNTLQGMPAKVFTTASSQGLLGPGESVTLKIKGTRRFNRLSLAAMLIPTNDTFVALDSILLPRYRKSRSVPAYDAGSEVDDELCVNIPGPFCMGDVNGGNAAEDGEGFVHIGNGIHAIGDLDAAVFDWRNPVAKVTVRRVRHNSH